VARLDELTGMMVSGIESGVQLKAIPGDATVDRKNGQIEWQILYRNMLYGVNRKIQDVVS
jgi:hypothetical protein